MDIKHQIAFITDNPNLSNCIYAVNDLTNDKTFCAISLDELNFPIVSVKNFPIEDLIENIKKVEHLKNKDIFICLVKKGDFKEHMEVVSNGLNNNPDYKSMVYEYEDYDFDNEKLLSQLIEIRRNAIKYLFIGRYQVNNLIKPFNQYINESKDTPPIKTGFNYLDTCIGGGLFPKLYVIGAETSLGKTTLVLQIADNVARQNIPVIIFSLEMLKEEIIARSISRESYIKNRKNEVNAFSEISILNGYNYSNYSNNQLMALRQAQNDYLSYANDNIYICEGRHTMDDIYSFVGRFINLTGRKPLVIIDYLQLVAPKDDKADIRYNINYSVDRLKEMRSKFKIPMFVISSFNRGSYGSEKDNASFKESGEIEYTADCTMVLELDYKRVNSNPNETRLNYFKALKGDNGIRHVFIRFLKNRGNPPGTEIHFNYNPKFNYFEEDYSFDD